MAELRQDLSPLLAPRSVAIIGANERGHFASSIHRNLARGGFPLENLFPVNPKYQRVFELSCYPTVKDIPDEVDLGIIVVPQRFVRPIARECGEKGVRSLLVRVSGSSTAQDRVWHPFCPHGTRILCQGGDGSGRDRRLSCGREGFLD